MEMVYFVGGGESKVIISSCLFIIVFVDGNYEIRINELKL